MNNVLKIANEILVESKKSKTAAKLVDIREKLWSKNWRKFWDSMDQLRDVTDKYRSLSSIKDKLNLDDTDEKVNDLLSDVNNILGVLNDKITVELKNIKDLESKFK